MFGNSLIAPVWSRKLDIAHMCMVFVFVIFSTDRYTYIHEITKWESMNGRVYTGVVKARSQKSSSFIPMGSTSSPWEWLCPNLLKLISPHAYSVVHVSSVLQYVKDRYEVRLL
jgi:hypothetical protein